MRFGRPQRAGPWGILAVLPAQRAWLEQIRPCLAAIPPTGMDSQKHVAHFSKQQFQRRINFALGIVLIIELLRPIPMRIPVHHILATRTKAAQWNLHLPQWPRNSQLSVGEQLGGLNAVNFHSMGRISSRRSRWLRRIFGRLPCRDGI